MRVDAQNLRGYFAPIIGVKPWRARLGFGSFLTFDFGPKIRKANHLYGAWHLWIYQCEWTLSSQNKCIVHSESSRRDIERAVRTLESYPLTGIRFDPRSFQTIFAFGKKIELTCKRYSIDLDIKHDELWMLFMPENKVLSVAPEKPILVESADLSSEVRAD